VLLHRNPQGQGIARAEVVQRRIWRCQILAAAPNGQWTVAGGSTAAPKDVFTAVSDFEFKSGTKISSVVEFNA
jgi:hypothetical protein